MPDAALGAVDVVVEEDVALAHLLDREVTGDRVHEGGVGPAGELAQQPVVDAGAEVVGVADHRAAAGPGDRGLDLHLHAGQRALDDLDQHRVGARPRVVGEAAEREVGGCAPAHASLALSSAGHDDVAVVVDAGGEAGVQRHGRAELLDDRRAVDDEPRRQVRPPQQRRVDVAGVRVEADRSRRPGVSRRAPLAPRRPAVLADLRPLDRPDPRDPQVHPLHLLGRVGGEVVAVERPVLGVEARGDRVQGGPVERARGRRAPAPRRPGRSSARPRSAGRRGPPSAKPSVVRAARAWPASASYAACRVAASRTVVERDVGLHVVVLDVDGQQAERRHVAGVGRHQHRRHAQDVHQPAQQQRARTAERGQGEVADVEAALDGHLAQRVGLVPRRDLQDAGRARLGAEAQVGGERLDPRAGRVDVERDLPAEQVRRDPAEDHVGVGDGDPPPRCRPCRSRAAPGRRPPTAVRP